MSLMDEIMGVAKEVGVEESAPLRPLPTPLDVMNAYNARWFNDASGLALHMGAPQGKQILIVGYTGAGKTTLGLQIAASQVAEFEGASIFHFDQEQAYTEDRVQDITGWTIEFTRKKYKNMKPESSENIYEFIRKIHTLKTGPNRKQYEVDGPNGRQLTPTVVIVDTVATLTTNAIDGKDSIGSVLAEPGSIAKTNNMIYQRLPRYLMDANITLISINHIRDKIEEGGAPTKKRVFSLGAKEAIPGGHGHMQMADYFIKVTGDGAALSSDERYKIDGKVIECVMIKSRLAREGVRFHLIYDPKVGFDNTLTNLHFLTTKKELKGAGAHLFFTTNDGRDSRKFSLGECRPLYQRDPDFRAHFDQKIEEALGKIVPDANEEFVEAGAGLGNASEEGLMAALGLTEGGDDVAEALGGTSAPATSTAQPARKAPAAKPAASGPKKMGLGGGAKSK